MESLQRHTYFWAGILFSILGLFSSIAIEWWVGLISLMVGLLFVWRGLQLRRAWNDELAATANPDSLS